MNKMNCVATNKQNRLNFKSSKKGGDYGEISLVVIYDSDLDLAPYGKLRVRLINVKVRNYINLTKNCTMISEYTKTLRGIAYLKLREQGYTVDKVKQIIPLHILKVMNKKAERLSRKRFQEVVNRNGQIHSEAEDAVTYVCECIKNGSLD